MVNILAPWILLLFGCVVLLSLALRRYRACLVMLLLLLCLNWLWYLFTIGLLSHPEGSDCENIKVLSWNVSSTHLRDADDVERILVVLNQQGADVVFLTEYNESANPKIDSVLNSVYPYKGILPNDTILGDFCSRIPIDTCMRIGSKDDGLLFRYDVRLRGSQLRLCCLHLHSNNYADGNLYYPDSIKDKGGLMRYLRNYETTAVNRKKQTKLVVDDVAAAPTIVMSDMNDVYGSPCMQVFANAGLLDAWWDGGFGYGASFHDPLPYRIDHILYSKGLKLRSIKKVDANGLSDHDALVAEFEVE